MNPYFYSLFYKNRANCYSKLKQYDKAINDYTEAIEIDPDEDNYYFERASLYSDLGQFEKAINDYTKALKLNPNDSCSYFNRAECYITLKQYKKAIDDYTKAMELDPNDSDSYVRRAACYYVLQHYKKALEDYSKLIKLLPNEADYYNYRAGCYIALKQYKKAIGDYDKAIELEPDNPAYYVMKEYLKHSAKKPVHNPFSILIEILNQPNNPACNILKKFLEQPDAPAYVVLKEFLKTLGNPTDLRDNLEIIECLNKANELFFAKDDFKQGFIECYKAYVISETSTKNFLTVLINDKKIFPEMRNMYKSILEVCELVNNKTVNMNQQEKIEFAKSWIGEINKFTNTVDYSKIYHNPKQGRKLDL